METSFYQELKLVILSMVNLSKDAIHIHIGAAVFFLSIVLWKKGHITTSCLIPVLGVACLMETLDLYDDYSSLGYMRWSASIHDLINTTIWPTIVVIYVKIFGISKDL